MLDPFPQETLDFAACFMLEALISASEICEWENEDLRAGFPLKEQDEKEKG